MKLIGKNPHPELENETIGVTDHWKLKKSWRVFIGHDRIAHLFTLGLFLGTLVLLFLLISPFLGTLVGAITLGISFYPLHRWIAKKLPRCSKSIHALISDFLVVMLIIVPLFLMVWAAFEQSDGWMPVVKNLQTNISQWQEGKILDSNEAVQDFRGWLNRSFAIRPSQIRAQVIKSADHGLDYLALIGTKVPGELVSSIGSLGLMIFALFFVFRDGDKIYSYLQSYLPLREEQKLECKVRGRLMVTGVIRGWLLGAVVQGVIAALGYLLAGVKGWIFFGFLTILAGLLPVVGTALIWFPLAINALIHGAMGQGIFLLIWGGAVVAFLDNILIRPYLIGRKSHVSFVYLIFALIGGIELWGLKGIILGPVLIAVAPVILDIYRKRYLSPSLDPLPLQTDQPSPNASVAQTQRREDDSSKRDPAEPS